MIRFLLILIFISPLSCSIEGFNEEREARRGGPRSHRLKKTKNNNNAPSKETLSAGEVEAHIEKLEPEVKEPSTEVAEVKEPSTEVAEVKEPSTEVAEVKEPSTEVAEVKEPSTEVAEVKEPSTEVAEVKEPVVLFPLSAPKGSKMNIRVNPARTVLVVNSDSEDSLLTLTSTGEGHMHQKDYDIELSLAKEDVTFTIRSYFQVPTLEIASGAQITQGQVLGTLKGPISLFLFKDNKIVPVCLKSINDGKVHIEYDFTVKSASDLPKECL